MSIWLGLYLFLGQFFTANSMFTSLILVSVVAVATFR